MKKILLATLLCAGLSTTANAFSWFGKSEEEKFKDRFVEHCTSMREYQAFTEDIRNKYCNCVINTYIDLAGGWNKAVKMSLIMHSTQNLETKQEIQNTFSLNLMQSFYNCMPVVTGFDIRALFNNKN